MAPTEINDALAQVRMMQELIIERQTFRGYSGLARIAGGVAALAGALVLGSHLVPATVPAHLLGWGSILVIALACNYGGLAHWFLHHPGARRDLVKLMPALDALPALAVGAALSVALILRDATDLLPGAWMACYGLVHVPYRKALPIANYWIGIFYMAAGALCLVCSGASFTDPIPMGIVFGVGEISGGAILHWNNRRGERLPAAAPNTADPQADPDSDLEGNPEEEPTP